MVKLIRCYSIILFLLLSTNAYSKGLLEGISQLASPYRDQIFKIVNNLSSKGPRLDGVQGKLSESQCMDILEKDKVKRSEETLHNVIYFLGGGYSEDKLSRPYEITPNCLGSDYQNSFKLGLTLDERLRPNSYDSDSILAEKRCVKYLEVKKVETVELELKGDSKVCRKIHLSIKDQSFASFFCVDDQRAYVDYHDYPVKILENIPFAY